MAGELRKGKFGSGGGKGAERRSGDNGFAEISFQKSL